MTDAAASLLLPGVLTVILYALALLVVVASRRPAAGPPRRLGGPRPPRGRPQLRVIPGGAARRAS